MDPRVFRVSRYYRPIGKFKREVIFQNGRKVIGGNLNGACSTFISISLVFFRLQENDLQCPEKPDSPQKDFNHSFFAVKPGKEEVQ